MSLAHEQPHFVLVCKDSGNWAFPVEYLEQFRELWYMETHSFTAPDLWGQRCTVLISDVRGVIEKTESSIARVKDEREEERSRDMIGTL